VKNYSQYGGSGLGLYICRSLVEIHGGQIGFRSKVGVGSAFGFCIKTKRISGTSSSFSAAPSTMPISSTRTNPQDSLASAKPTRSIPVPKRKILDSLHIMIVEDNIINQKVLSKQLQKAGHIVTIANHGQECLDLLADSHFCKVGGSKVSIVLMDVEMPVMNGIDCTREIRMMEKDGKINNRVPIIATTGNARNEKVELITQAGVDRVILKPYSIQDLMQLVEILTQSNET
jgi:CheY-like chemotaxis protein